MTTLTSPLPPARQQPAWPDPDALAEVERQLAVLPPLVTEDEAARAAARFAAVARGEALLLHGGDCAERFEDSDPDTVRRKLAQLGALAATARARTGLAEVVPVGRIAGQYAKPRSADHEPGPDGRPLASYRGDAVNAPEPDARLRTPDPRRLLTAYDCARRVLDTVRETWREQPEAERALVSHELLLLPFERALARKGERGHFAGSAHFGWVGERTREPHGAHIDFAAAVHNPVGVKLGPSTTPAEAVELARRLNPEGAYGRLTFLVRMGADRVERALPPVVAAVVASGTPVVWLCDPMHGNTFRTPGGVKTRALPDIRREIAAFVRVLRAHGAWPGGLSLELTPDPVSECVDVPRAAAGGADLSDYRSACDPRLGPRQAEAAVETFVDALGGTPAP